jgi:xylulose-5-phosphate/fructose-6-phosphate phosphoketolase
VTAAPDDPTPTGSAAADYWRAACLLSFSHSAGLSWPPPGEPQRPRTAGHWGCNPGIAWAAAHLAAASGDDGFLLVVGTGHAGSYAFAHQALCSGAPPDAISAAIRRYGAPGGDPTELLGEPGVPYIGGELGPALGVSQGIAAASPGLLVAVVIGDGECETPAALAAFAHHEVLPPAPGACWLPVVNVNGARMGSAARFSPARLRALLEGMGYTVLDSGNEAAEAAAAARGAWELARAGTPVAWLSVTEKGWPAPEELGGRPFHGHHAHKTGGLDLTDPSLASEVGKWLDTLNDPPVVDADGAVSGSVRRLASLIRTRLPGPGGLSGPPAQRSRPAPGRPGLDRAAVAPATANAPMIAVDQLLATRSVRVLSPDEAASNRLDQCLAAGLVTELLAEELCSAWAWGHVEAGTPAAVVSYEAFAPLLATQLAQYLKLLATRPPAGRPALVTVLTSLGWGNSPTHQNTDLAGILLARCGTSPARVLFPIGAASARDRLDELLDDRDTVAALLCSKQSLLDLPDPGGPAVGIRMAETGGDDATIVAVGDVAVTEAVAAMALARRDGVRLGVVALVEPGRLDGAALDAVRRACPLGRPVVCVSWVAAHYLASAYAAAGVETAAWLGYRERWGATPWDTLAANELTRWALLRRLLDAGCPLPARLARPSGADPGPLIPDGLSCEVRPL